MIAREEKRPQTLEANNPGQELEKKLGAPRQKTKKATVNWPGKKIP